MTFCAIVKPQRKYFAIKRGTDVRYVKTTKAVLMATCETATFSLNCHFMSYFFSIFHQPTDPNFNFQQHFHQHFLQLSKSTNISANWDWPGQLHPSRQRDMLAILSTMGWESGQQSTFLQGPAQNVRHHGIIV